MAGRVYGAGGVECAGVQADRRCVEYMNQSWHQFFAMGGYGRYVWSAYGIAAVVLLGNIVAPVVAHRRIKRRIRNAQFEDD